jgi:peptide/nickel transport system substrate-binding protein
MGVEKRSQPVLLLAFCLLVCSAQARTLRKALSDDATTLDPHVANLAINTRLQSNIYEGLVRRDKDFNIAPGLAESWSQPDARTWRFGLRKGVKFHDGSDFTADDVLFTVERTLHPLSIMKWTLQGVASARKIDAHTVELKMTEPNPVLLLHLVNCFVMSKAWSKKHGVIHPQNYSAREETYAVRNANGTGPYKILSRELDVKTVLVEHAQWWNRNAPDRGNVTRIEWTPIKSNSTRMAALMTGAIDFVPDSAIQDRARLASHPDVKLLVETEPRVIFLALDQFRPELHTSRLKGKNPFKDLRVRQAIAHAIDVKSLIDKVLRGYGRPTALLVGSEVNGYAADLDKRLPYDVARARKLMAEAGYANGFDVTFDCDNQSPFLELSQAIAPMLAAIGIEVRLNVMSFSAIFPKIDRNDTSGLVMGYGAPTMDAQSLLQALVASKGGSDGKAPGVGDSNFGRYANPKLDALVARIAIEGDSAKRNVAIREALTIERDELAVIPLYHAKIAWAMRKNIEASYKGNAVPVYYRFKVGP